MTCPSNPPPPEGYAVWQGPVPTPHSQWAVDLRSGGVLGPSIPYGTMWTRDYNGIQVIARKDYHTWTYVNGVLQTGICIPGLTLYAPIATRALDLESNDPGSEPPGATDWGLVAVTGLALVGVVGLFFLALKAFPSK